MGSPVRFVVAGVFFAGVFVDRPRVAWAIPVAAVLSFADADSFAVAEPFADAGASGDGRGTFVDARAGFRGWLGFVTGSSSRRLSSRPGVG
jgi:hypothetical protein